MSLSIQYWKQSISWATAIWFAVVLVVFFMIYAHMLVQSYAAFSAYQVSARTVARLLDKQVVIDQAARVAELKRQHDMLQKALAQDSGRAEIHFELGEFMSAVTENPDLLQFLGLPDMESADAARRNALSHYMHALERFPTNSIYQQRLGLLYSVLGFPANARCAFSNAELLDPRNASLHLFLAQYYWGNRDELAFNKQASIIATIYSQGLKGGGRVVDHKARVEEFFQSIGKEEMLR